MSRSAPATPTTDGGDVPRGATTGAVSESRYPRPKASTYGSESTSGGFSRKAETVPVNHVRAVGRYVRKPSTSASSEPTAPGHWRNVLSMPPMKMSTQCTASFHAGATSRSSAVAILAWGQSVCKAWGPASGQIRENWVRSAAARLVRRHERRHIAAVQRKARHVGGGGRLGYLLQGSVAAALRIEVGVGCRTQIARAGHEWRREVGHVVVGKQGRREQRVRNLLVIGIEYSHGQRQNKRSCALCDDGVECHAHVAQNELAVLHNLLEREDDGGTQPDEQNEEGADRAAEGQQQLLTHRALGEFHLERALGGQGVRTTTGRWAGGQVAMFPLRVNLPRGLLASSKRSPTNVNRAEAVRRRMPFGADPRCRA
eukprot:scaffold63559_cov75-Phaeocystis_antarctica.AAC.11